ncbi:MAG: stage II sporulation protein P [Clostridia bacterium]|nr:stage II sporulation protein P [Clostridia bacterium]
MINMAVVSLKDIIKYLIKITIIIAVAIGLIRCFAYMKEGIKNTQMLQRNSLLSCLDITIPGIASIHEGEEKKQTDTVLEPLNLLFGMELKMIGSVNKEKNVALEENNKEEEEKNKEEETTIEKATTGLKTQVQSSNVPEKYTTQYNGVKVRNETDYKLTKELLAPNIKVNKENIIIFHTHACESYTSSEKYSYKPTGNFRTTDKNYSVVRVGKELSNQLKSYGYKTIHSEVLHDYPSYSGSYTNSLKTVNKLLEENKNTDIVIDLHRDAIGDTSYAPTVKIGDEYAAQIMFVIGGNGSSIKHETWQQNLKFAVKVQEKANQLYPGLFKPIILRYSGYNQHVAKAAVIIEVGATGNTLDQTLVSMKYLAKVMDEVLK